MKDPIPQDSTPPLPEHDTNDYQSWLKQAEQTRQGRGFPPHLHPLFWGAYRVGYLAGWKRRNKI